MQQKRFRKKDQQKNARLIRKNKYTPTELKPHQNKTPWKQNSAETNPHGKKPQGINLASILTSSSFNAFGQACYSTPKI